MAPSVEPKAASVGRGHKHPHGKNQVLRNGPKLGNAGICEIASFPGIGRMFMARPSGGLWHI